MFEEHTKRDINGDRISRNIAEQIALQKAYRERQRLKKEARKKIIEEYQKQLHDWKYPLYQRGICFICGEKEKPINRHHLEPKTPDHPSKGFGTILTCLRCHRFIHIRWTNFELRQMTGDQLRAKILEELMINHK